MASSVGRHSVELGEAGGTSGYQHELSQTPFSIPAAIGALHNRSANASTTSFSHSVEHSLSESQPRSRTEMAPTALSDQRSTQEPPSHVFRLRHKKEDALSMIRTSQHTEQFLEFVNGANCDLLLGQAILYIVSLFNLEKARKVAEIQFDSVEAMEALYDAEQECASILREMARVYGAILLEGRNMFCEQVKERQFYETLYDFIVKVLFQTFDRKLWKLIKDEIGRLFRTPDFQPDLPDKQKKYQFIKAKDLYTLHRDPDFHMSVKRYRNISNRHFTARSPLMCTIFPTRSPSPSRRRARNGVFEHRLSIPTDILYLPFDLTGGPDTSTTRSTSSMSVLPRKSLSVPKTDNLSTGASSTLATPPTNSTVVKIDTRSPQ